MERIVLQTLTPTLMPIHSIAILLLYLTHPTILNPHKLSEPHNINYITSSTVYYIFNNSFPKGTGSDGFASWFLKLISSAICEPLLTIYNCIKQAFFPAQWKNSIIHSIKMINNPTQSISPHFHYPYSFSNT